MAKKLRPTGTGSADITVVPSGSGRLIYYVNGGFCIVYAPSRIEGPDTIYTEISREPIPKGYTLTAVRHGD